jgi:GWxTD domain-containing protein
MRGAVLAVLGVFGWACGPWQRVGSDGAPATGTTIPRLFDARPIYRSMGLFVAGAPLPFVGGIRYLAGGRPDSTLAVLSLSLANQALRFRRDGDEFLAQYRVEVVVRGDSGVVRELTREETVRVRSFQETLRADESVIFQQFFRLPPGGYRLSVVVRDRVGPALNRVEGLDTVPAFTTPSLGGPLPYYEGDGRDGPAELPRLLLNPRATLPYGADSLRVYVEAYGLPARAPVAVRVLDGTGNTVWQDTVALAGTLTGFGHATVLLAPAGLPVGRLELEASAAGAPPVRLAFLVSFSGQYVITNFEEMVSLLRYFDRQDLVAKLRDAAPADRPGLWVEFWRASDPVPITPENEALEEYFRKVQQANLRFPEEGAPGWLTDRGEVFITLGEPDEIIDQSSGLDRGGLRLIRWSYTNHRLAVLFQDETGFGRFRLTPSSRAEYMRVLARVRRGQ